MVLGNKTGKIDSYYTTEYTYDIFNRLSSVTQPGLKTQYTYKADNMRISKTVNGETTNHIWDGSNIVAETNGLGSVIDAYVRGGGLISSNQHGYYLFNGHGDVVQITDSTGNVLRDYDFDAFGVKRDGSDTDTNPWRYCAEYTDLETGSIYLRHRYYDPAMGRFLNEDPIRHGANWYTYVGNNPIAYVDPLGLKEVAAADYARSYGATVTWLGNVNYLGGVCAKAEISFNGITQTVMGVLKNDKLMMQDYILNERFGFSDNPVSIVKNGNTTTIHAVVSISGDRADDIVGSTTYRRAIADGIKSNWEGSYAKSGNVNVYVTDLNDGKSHTVPATQRSLSITMSQGSGVSNMPGGSWKSYSDPGEIYIYESRDGNLQSAKNIGWIAAHEFGHVLGIGDAYPAVAGSPITDVYHNNIRSIMNKFGTHAQGIDIEMALKAYTTDTWQAWPEYVPPMTPSR